MGKIGMTKYILVATVLLVPFLLWVDHRSLERGNRLYRAGNSPGAAEVYRDSESGSEQLPTVEYNLGTALLEIDPDSAQTHLFQVVEGNDRTTAQRALYNLGYRFLTAVQNPMELDATVSALTAAVATNRLALRLDPDDGSARWNLALAQDWLDALAPPPAEDAPVSGSDLGAESENTGIVISGPRQGAVEGEREALAGQDPGPMTATAAEDLLEAVIDEPDSLIIRILWSHRPDVPWWERQAFPGGGW
jgi:hypothetical protein